MDFKFENKQEAGQMLDFIVYNMIKLEEEIGIMDFIKECIEMYYNHELFGWEYDVAKDEFLNKVYKD